MSGLRKNNSSCGYGQGFDPYMMGSSKGFGMGNGRQSQMISMNTMSTPNYNYSAPNRTASLRNTTTPTVQECMHWPASLSNQKTFQYQQQQQQQKSTYARNNRNAGYANSGGDVSNAMFCSAPPKVYMSVPGMGGKKAQMTQQNIPCQIAPLGTDPMSLIKPLAPLTVNIQAPADLFAGNSSEPRTICISPAQLYGGR